MPSVTQLLVSLGGAVSICVLILTGLRLLSDRRRELNLVFLQVTMARKESREDKQTEAEEKGKDFKEVVGVMDHLFQSLYATYDHRFTRFFSGQEFFSVELATMEDEMLFFLVVPRRIVPLIEKQVTSFYPDAVIEAVEDYNIFTENSVVACTYLVPMRHYRFPLKGYEQMKSDPLNAIVNTFSKLSRDEGAAIQIVIRPISSSWQKKSEREARRLLNPRVQSIQWWNPIDWMSAVFDAFRTPPPTPKPDERTHDRVPSAIEELSKALDQKASSPGYAAVLRVLTSASTRSRARLQLENIRGGFAQFDAVRGNSLRATTLFFSCRKVIEDFIRRTPRRPFLQMLLRRRAIFSCAELASLYHFPNITYNRLPIIKWQNFKIAPAPKNIPTGEEEGGIRIGVNSYRGDKVAIYLKHTDRFRHTYIIGQTGTGKSTMIIAMARQDFRLGNGCCIVDPHGSLAEDCLKYVPRERIDDVIYFNPADTERPLGLNLLEGKTEEEKDLIALDAMNMMVKMFGEEIFGPRIQDYFRNGCITLMADEEEGGAITDLVRLFTDDEWQQYKVSKVKNPIVRAFWEKQMVATGQREKQEMIPYFAAKFGQFTTNTLIRNIVGQVKSAFDFSEAMQGRKIIIMNLSKGLIGDINSQLLGLVVVNKIQVAAMRRQRQAAEERQPFFLYIDEFQNYITESIESILSEARKFQLGLIMAHQYLSQLKEENKLSKSVDLQGAVFGNVGTIVAYKIGAQDAEFMAKEMAPVFSEQDLINIDKFKAVMKLSVDSQPSRPFSLIPDNPFLEKGDTEAADAIKQISRLKYGRDKEFVNREIIRRIGA
jgi:hypothetical protein